MTYDAQSRSGRGLLPLREDFAIVGCLVIAIAFVAVGVWVVRGWIS